MEPKEPKPLPFELLHSFVNALPSGLYLSWILTGIAILLVVVSLRYAELNLLREGGMARVLAFVVGFLILASLWRIEHKLSSRN